MDENGWSKSLAFDYTWKANKEDDREGHRDKEWKRRCRQLAVEDAQGRKK